jgi:hypothetical protein
MQNRKEAPHVRSPFKSSRACLLSLALMPYILPDSRSVDAHREGGNDLRRNQVVQKLGEVPEWTLVIVICPQVLHLGATC